MAVLVLDWDKVVFDTGRFKKDFFDLLQSVAGTDPEASYEEAKKSGFYDPDHHFSLLANGNLSVLTDLYRRTRTLLQLKSAEYVFPDAGYFLNVIPSSFSPLYILSKGRGWFQRLKIWHSGFLDRFSGIFIAEDRNKIPAFKDIVSCCGEDEDYVLIDDSGEEIDSLINCFRGILKLRVFQLIRDQARVQASGLAHVKISDLCEVFGVFMSSYH